VIVIRSSMFAFRDSSLAEKEPVMRAELFQREWMARDAPRCVPSI